MIDREGVLPLAEIPLAPIYARKTGFFTSRPPLLDQALINFAHYQKYSNFSIYQHISTRLILWFRGCHKSKKLEAIGPHVFFDVNSGNEYVGFLLNIVGTDYLRAGLVFRQSSDGKLVYRGLG